MQSRGWGGGLLQQQTAVVAAKTRAGAGACNRTRGGEAAGQKERARRGVLGSAVLKRTQRGQAQAPVSRSTQVRGPLPNMLPGAPARSGCRGAGWTLGLPVAGWSVRPGQNGRNAPGRNQNKVPPPVPRHAAPAWRAPSLPLACVYP